MAFELLDSSGNLLSVKITGQLRQSEMRQAQALAAEAIRQRGRIKLLVILEGFEGWERGADWGDVTFVVEHDRDIEKIAVVGPEGWKEMVYAFAGRGYRSTPIEFFGPSELDQARAWLER